MASKSELKLDIISIVNARPNSGVNWRMIQDVEQKGVAHRQVASFGLQANMHCRMPQRN